MKKSKSQILILFLIFIIIIASTYYAYSADMKDFLNRYIILGSLLLNIILIRILYRISNKKYKKAINEYDPIRNIKISKTSKMVLLKNENKIIPSMQNDIANISSASNANDKVVLLHIDTVNNKKINIKLFKDHVSMLDVVREINK